MVHKFVNFAKVLGMNNSNLPLLNECSYLHPLEALRKPVYVEATSQSSIITPSAQNAYDSVSIQLPMEPSSHVAKIIADAAGCAPWCICFHEATNRETTCGSQMHLETCRDTITWNQKPQLSKRQASKTRSEIVIAHGTYHPETKQISPGPVVPRSSKSSRKTRKPRQPTFKAPPTPPKTPPIHLWKKFETYYEPPSYMPPSPPAVFEYQLFYPPCYDHPFPYHNYGQDYAYDPAYCYYLGYPNQAPQFYGMAEQVYSLEAPKYPTHSHRRARGTWNQRSNPVQGRIARGLYW